MGIKITRKILEQSWVHSHEEDTGTEMVFRPAKFRFPPSRGRKSFKLKSGGSLLQEGIGPADSPLQEKGTWKLMNEDELAFFFHDETTPRLVLKIVSLEKDRLAVRRL